MKEVKTEKDKLKLMEKYHKKPLDLSLLGSGYVAQISDVLNTWMYWTIRSRYERGVGIYVSQWSSWSGQFMSLENNKEGCFPIMLHV